MKLKRLKLTKTRGIISETMEPDCKNMGIYGPNGQGKSAVIDGLDFLLTGTISRLTGEGGKELSLRRHGPNVTVDKADDAMVEGVFVLKTKEEVTIKRTFSEPNSPIITGGAGAKKLAEEALQIASRGQHILTRREILQFITATGKDRSIKIQGLLKLQQTEKLRLIFKNIQNSSHKTEESKVEILSNEKNRIVALIGLSDQTNFETNTLDFVNEKRKILGSDSLVELKSTSIFDKTKPITQVNSGKTVSPTEYTSALKILKDFSNFDQLADTEEKIVSLLKYKSLSNLMIFDLEKQIQMMDLGTSLVVDDSCPLCGHDWEKARLISMLKEKREKLSEANGEYKDYAKKRDDILFIVNPLVLSLETLINGLKIKGVDLLAIWRQNLLSIKGDIEEPISVAKKYEERDKNFLVPKGISKRIGDLEVYLETKYPKKTPEQDAWDTLTQIKTLLEGLESSLKEFKKAEEIRMRSDVAYTKFVEARDEIVQDIYNSINGEFMSYYKLLNGDDESAFKSKLTSNGPGLDFEVDFYGYGEHPPNALHSEGHQDSMGICIFLALSKKFSEDALDIIMLDDVVMSIDSDHREKFADLIKEHFPDKQFIITTHERVWSKQLIRKKVTLYNVEFSSWNPTKGPNTRISKDWKGGLEDLVNSLNAGEDNNSIGSFRKIIEEEFLEICLSLDVKTSIRLDNNFTLNDLVPPALKKFEEVLKETSKITSGKVRTKDDYTKMQTDLANCRKKLDQKSWMINPATHYTDWENFTINEKAELVILYSDLLNSFFCPICKMYYHINPNEEILLCDCNN